MNWGKSDGEPDVRSRPKFATGLAAIVMRTSGSRHRSRERRRRSSRERQFRLPWQSATEPEIVLYRANSRDDRQLASRTAFGEIQSHWLGLALLVRLFPRPCLILSCWPV